MKTRLKSTVPKEVNGDYEKMPLLHSVIFFFVQIEDIPLN